MADLVTCQRAFLGALTGPAASPARGMDVYRNAYRATLRNAVRRNHRRCAAWLGDDRFDAVADAYAEASPSPFRNLRDYGAGFATFLADRFPDDLDIAELAALDWAIDTAFDGPDAQALDAAAIGALAPEDWIVRPLTLHPAATLVEATHNLAPVWQALDQQQPPPDMAQFGRKATLLVWRMDGKPHFRTLDADEDSALRLVACGGHFAEVCALLADRLGDDAATRRAGALLATWLGDAILCWAVPPPC